MMLKLSQQFLRGLFHLAVRSRLRGLRIGVHFSRSLYGSRLKHRKIIGLSGE